MPKIPRLYMIVGVAFVVLLSLFMLFQSGLPLFIIGLLLSIIIGAYLYAGHIVTPIFTKIMKITYTKGEYVFPPGQDVIIKRSGSKFIAAKYMLINIPEREEIAGKSEERAEIYMRDFEAALGAINAPIKLNLLVSTKDIAAYRESIQAKVYEASLRIKREMEKAEPDVIKIDRWQKEKEINENLLRRLASGVKPIAAVMYVMTVAKGITMDEARDKVLNQSKEIKAVLSNSFNAEIVDLVGEDAEMCLEWEYTIPTSYSELVEKTG
ncbi:MAG: hypothetical protein N3G76_01300 [Candidatus Micrarchaeota archaeon]|nr:hypothetical protein [Candidatus Micrarchaeota archaeon]